VDKADRSAATVRKTSRIACRMASRCANINVFLPDAILARDTYPGVSGTLTLVNRFKLRSSALELKEAIVGHVARALWTLLASVGLVLLVA
jgi:hypothetical protein